MAVLGQQCLWCGSTLTETQKSHGYWFDKPDCCERFVDDIRTDPGTKRPCAICEVTVDENSLGLCRACRVHVRAEQGYHLADAAMTLKAKAWNMERIARRLHRNQSTIDYWISRHPAGYRKPRQIDVPAWSQAEAEAIFARALKEGGYTNIAAELGVKNGVVIGRLWRRGLKLSEHVRCCNGKHKGPAIPPKTGGGAGHRHSGPNLPGPHRPEACNRGRGPDALGAAP